ncbi:Protein charlatan [Halotydeus destructor]|nr:Protein charlatan [Halotydeus destructor]
MATDCQRLEELLMVRRPAGSSFVAPGLFSGPEKNRPRTTRKSGGRSRRLPAHMSGLRRRYQCPKCPYSTDRRDLFTRHENIHRDEKPFRCYVCNKMFNRADHVKKHFLRIHKGLDYDVKLTKRIKGIDYEVTGNAPRVENSNLKIALTAVNDRTSTFASQLMTQMLEANAFYLPKMAAGLSPMAGVPFSISAANICAMTNAMAIKPSVPKVEMRVEREVEEVITPVILEQPKMERPEVKVIEEPEVVEPEECEKKPELVDEDESSLEPPDYLEIQLRSLSSTDSNRSSSSSSSSSSSDTDTTPVPEPKEEPKVEPVKAESPQLAVKSEQQPQREEHTEPCYDCEYCGCAFADYKSLHTHRYLLHRYLNNSETLMPYCCFVCGKRSVTHLNMIKHMKEHKCTKKLPKGTLVSPMVKWGGPSQPSCSSLMHRSNSLSDLKLDRRKQFTPRKLAKSASNPIKTELKQHRTGDNSGIVRAANAKASNFVCVCGENLVNYKQYIQHRKFLKH